MQEERRKSNGKVRVISPNLYARSRLLVLSGDALHETTDEPWLTERLLHLIWHYQRIIRDRLATLEGQAVLVLHPGFWNREAGPDFRNAVIRIGAGPSQTGDVELDLDPSGWRHHHHDQNPAYKKVMLHVVWDCDPGLKTPVPTLRLKPVLDAPIQDLRRWLGRNSLKRFAEPLLGQCSAPLKELPEPVVDELLRQAGLVRLQAKASELEARARQVGWELALWEGIFGALGFKHNVWPMRRIAELLPQILTGAQNVVRLQGILLGLSGLLPGEVAGARPSAQQYLRSLWDVWWRCREGFADSILPRAAWQLSGARPANHPQRRLALAAHWIARSDLLPKLEQWFRADLPDRQLLASLHALLGVSEDGFWSWHWTLTSPRLRRSQPLIGPPRVSDLAMNSILPWFWMRAVAGKNDALRGVAEHRYFAWPRSQDNAVLRLARQRLFGAETRRRLKTGAAQQGLLQIVRDFCDHSNALCENCRFPELVREWE